MSSSIDRLENLIRVPRGVAPDELNMGGWCNCAVGHASRDQYFIDEGMTNPELDETPMASVANFFGLTRDQSHATFLSSGYAGEEFYGRLPTPADVIAKLQVMLMEKRAQEPAELPNEVDLGDFLRGSSNPFRDRALARRQGGTAPGRPAHSSGPQRPHAQRGADRANRGRDQGVGLDDPRPLR